MDKYNNQNNPIEIEDLEENNVNINNIANNEREIIEDGDNNDDEYNLGENQDNQANKSKEEEPIYVMTLELEEGVNTYINIYSYSNPEQLAYEFCQEHNLPEESFDFLKSEIESLMINYFNLKNGNVAQASQSSQNNQNMHNTQNSLSNTRQIREEIIEVDETFSEGMKDNDHGPTYSPRNIENIEFKADSALNENENIEEAKETYAEENNLKFNKNNNFNNINYEDDELNEHIEENDQNEYSAKEEDIEENYNEQEDDQIEDILEDKQSSNKMTSISIDKIKANNYAIELLESTNRNDDKERKLFSENENFEVNQQNNNNLITDTNIIIEREKSSIYKRNTESNEDQRKDSNEGVIFNVTDNTQNNNIIINRSDYSKSSNNENQPTSIKGGFYSNLEQRLIKNNLIYSGKPTSEVSFIPIISTKSKEKNKQNEPIEKREDNIIITNEKNQTSSQFFNQISILKSSPEKSINYINNKSTTQRPITAIDYIRNKQIQSNLKKESPTIFERLYKEAEIKRKLKSNLVNYNKQIEKETPKIKMSNNDIGEQLYLKGIQAKEMKKNEIAKIKKDIDEEEKQFCTFKPEITRLNINNTTTSFNRNSNYNNFDSKRYYAQKEEKIQKLRDRLYKTDEESNSYIPKINKNYSSERVFSPITNSRGTTPNRLINQDTYKNQQIMKQSNNHETTSKYQQFNTGNSLNNISTASANINSSLYNIVKNQPFSERQTTYQKASENKLNDLRSKYTSHELTYKPLIESKDYYYNTAKNYHGLDNSSTLIKNYEQYLSKVKSKSPERFTNDNIFNQLKEETFKLIFSLLDSDGDDHISSRYININNLSTKNKRITNIISPLINELYEDNESLCCDEFILSMNQLFNYMSTNDRRDITEFGRSMKREWKKQIK